MPLALIFIGMAMLLLSWQNNQGAFVEQIGQDFSSGYFEWFGACLAIGVIGFVPELKGFSRGIMGLILLVFVLTKGQGLFSKVQSAITSVPTAQSGTAAPTVTATDYTDPGITGASGPYARPTGVF